MCRRSQWNWVVAAFWHFDDFRLELPRSAPIIGQQTREILAELGYSAERIKALYESGTVAGPKIPAGWQH